MKLLVLLTLFLSSPALRAQSIGHRYQHDYFQKLNGCGTKTESELRAVRFSFEHKNLKLGRTLIANVHEQFSGFAQTLIHNGQNWFYPSFNGHHEFQRLSCGAQSCRAEFFVFLSELALAKPDWLFRLTFFDDGAFHSKVAEASLSLHNPFQQAPDVLFKDTKVTVRPEALVATVDTKKLKRLLKDGHSVLLMWQLKQSREQHQYDEVVKQFAGPAAVDELKAGSWTLPKPTAGLSYIGFLVYVTKNDQAYESKVEVRNQRDSFYLCQ